MTIPEDFCCPKCGVPLFWMYTGEQVDGYSIRIAACPEGCWEEGDEFEEEI